MKSRDNNQQAKSAHADGVLVFGPCADFLPQLIKLIEDILRESCCFLSR